MTKEAVGKTLQKGQQQKERQETTKICQEINKKRRENPQLHRVKIRKYLLERH